ncbi:MAG TPA: DUF2723 domain-containing protein [Gemmatimonadales bacterium]|nr:DUF2723 domain-containing protein [Gemmatimonadales bacterium]
MATNASTSERPPYLLALLAGLVVLAGYIVTLAPTVTFWDAGEFIATAHILGIPHPPGTPLFVLLGNFFDQLSPLPTAYTTNLMSATFSAGSASFLFLFVHQALARGAEGLDPVAAKLFRVGGAFAAALVAAFSFTVWQNSNETEVYQIAMFSIGVIAWLCWLWRRDRGGVRGAHLQLLIVYMLGVSLGNHLMALLCGPAVIGFMFHVLRTEPARLEAERSVQWAQWAVLASLWVAMVGVGTGSKGILVLGLLLFLAAAGWAIRAGAWLFAVAALVVTAVGVSTYAFLYVRAGLAPFINEADPSTFENLWAVIRREQYPPRSPFDNPIYPSGPDNPGRSGKILLLQIANYLQYFDWQWSAALERASTFFSMARAPFTLLFLFLGVLGLMEHRRWDRSSFWFLFTLWLTTSAGLVLYLNFKPGFSIGYEWFPDREAHEVRERDYFYTVSYVMWGLWAGLGIAAAFRALRERLNDRPAWAAAPLLLVALLPFTLNFKAASRAHGPSVGLPRDFAYSMLQSVEPYGILFTNGDNDTFPLWYIQEVEGVRQDVMIVNLSLVNTDWYIRQLRDNPQRAYRPDSAAARLYGATAPLPIGCTPQLLDSLNAWARRAGRRPIDLSRGAPMCLHTLNDNQIAAMQAQLLSRDYTFRAGNITQRYPAGTPFYIKDVMVLRLIQENLGKRPIYFALTAGTGNRMGLDRYITQQALVFKLHSDTVSAGPDRVMGLFNSLVDVERTRVLAWEVYRQARLFDVDSLWLDPTDDNIAGNLAFVYMTLGEAYRQMRDVENMTRNYQRAAHLSRSPELRSYLQQLQAAAAFPSLFGPETAAGDTLQRR